MCARIQIRSNIDSACLAVDQSFYHATKMHWWRKIQLWWLPPNVAIPSQLRFSLSVTHFDLYLSSSHSLSFHFIMSFSLGCFLWAGEWRQEIYWVPDSQKEKRQMAVERERERGRHCCRKNTSTLVHSRQRFTGPAPLHYITQACGRSNGRNPNHRLEVQEKSSVCLWFLPPRSTAGFWGKSRHACPNIGDFGWRAEDQRLSPLTKDSIMTCHTWLAIKIYRQSEQCREDANRQEENKS